MQKKILVLLMAASLAACGGGGGGGSDAPSSPEASNGSNTHSGNDGSEGNSGGNSNSGNNPGVTDLRSGIFSDAPVSGLRYVQGSLSGYTNEDGQFQYDAASSADIQFYIGDLYLGSASGGSVVTPFDLSINGVPVSLTAGVNISRVLISLDEDSNPDNGIALPDAARDAKGQIEFGLPSGQFEADPYVQYLVEQYAPAQVLESVITTRNHLALNAAAQQRIDELSGAVNTAIDNIDLHWNSTLNGAAILAHIRSSNGEELVLKLNEQNDALWIQHVIYANADGVRVVEFNQNGSVAYVDNKGAVSKYVEFSELDMARFIKDFQAYHPQATAYLANDAGLASAQQMHHFHHGRINDVATILQRHQDGQVSTQDQLQMAAHFMSLFESVICTEAEDCAQRSLLSGALLRALDDSVYRADIVHAIDVELNDQLCLGSLFNDAMSSCPPSQLIMALLLDSDRRIQVMRQGERDRVIPIKFDRVLVVDVSNARKNAEFLRAFTNVTHYGPWDESYIRVIPQAELIHIGGSDWLFRFVSFHIEMDAIERCENEPVWVLESLESTEGEYSKSRLRCHYTSYARAQSAEMDRYRALAHQHLLQRMQHSVVYRKFDYPDGPRFCARYAYWPGQGAFMLNDGCGAREVPETFDEQKTAAIAGALEQASGDLMVTRMTLNPSRLEFSYVDGDGIGRWDMFSSSWYYSVTFSDHDDIAIVGSGFEFAREREYLD